MDDLIDVKEEIDVIDHFTTQILDMDILKQET